MFVECRIFVLGLQLLWSHCLVYQQFWLEKIECVFKYVVKSPATFRLEYNKCFDSQQATSTASQVEAEKGDQNCIWFSWGSSHLTPNVAFATGLLLLIIYFNGIGTSLPVLCSPWIPLIHTSSQQILTEQWWFYWHAQGSKHEKIRFVQIQASQELGAHKTTGTISNDMDISKLCRDLLPPLIFLPWRKKQKAPVCKQMRTPQSSLRSKAFAAARELWLQLLLQPDTSSKIAPSHLLGPISSPEEGFYRGQLSFPPALDPVTQC